MKHKQSRGIAATAAIAAALLSSSPVAASTSEPCAYGDARMRFETFPLTFEGTPPPCVARQPHGTTWAG